MSAFDWNTFIATLIATIVGALVASFVGLAVARADRPQPYFRAEAKRPTGAWWRNADGTVSITVQLWNIGDGPAYNVRLRASGGAEDRYEVDTAKLEPGGVLLGSIAVPGEGEMGANVYTGVEFDDRSVTWPERALAHITWHQPPQRSRRRHAQIALHDPFSPHPSSGTSAVRSTRRCARGE